MREGWVVTRADHVSSGQRPPAVSGPRSDTSSHRCRVTSTPPPLITLITAHILAIALYPLLITPIAP